METVAAITVETAAVMRVPIRETVAADAIATVSVKSAEPPKLCGRQKRPPEMQERLSGMRERL